MDVRAIKCPKWFANILNWLRGITSEPRRYLKHGIPPTEKVPLRSRIILGSYLLFRALYDSDMTVRAASTAYTFVFSLVPLLTTSLAFFTAFAGEQYQKKLQSMLLTYLLPGAVDGVQQYIDQFTSRAATMGTVSSLVFFVTILLLFRSLEDTFNRIWKSERSRTWGERLQVLALFFIVGALAATAMITASHEASVLGEEIAKFDLGGLQPTLAQLGLQATGLLTAWVFFVLVNKVLPKTRVQWVPALVGGVMAGTLWQLTKSGFTWYIQDVASYGHIYGAVGTIPIFFLWIYLSMLIMLLSAYTAFVTQNFRAIVAWQRLEDQGGDQPAYYSVAVAAMLARGFMDRHRPMTTPELAHALGFDGFYVMKALHPLTRAGVVRAVASKGEDERYLLAVPAESLSLGEVVRLATGENLEIPNAEHPSELYQRVKKIFGNATSQEDNVLERTKMKELADLLPALEVPEKEDEDGSDAQSSVE